MTDFTIISSNVVTSLEEIRLYDETVEKVKQGHPEIPVLLPSITIAVERALVDPTHVEASRSDSKSVVFVDSDSTNASGDPLRVPVKHYDDDSKKSGRVKSFYFASTNADPTIIYRRPDEHD